MLLVVDAVRASVCMFCVGVCLLCRFIGWGGLVVGFGGLVFRFWISGTNSFWDCFFNLRFGFCW